MGCPVLLLCCFEKECGRRIHALGVQLFTFSAAFAQLVVQRARLSVKGERKITIPAAASCKPLVGSESNAMHDEWGWMNGMINKTLQHLQHATMSCRELSRSTSDFWKHWKRLLQKVLACYMLVRQERKLHAALLACHVLDVSLKV